MGKADERICRGYFWNIGSLYRCCRSDRAFRCRYGPCASAGGAADYDTCYGIDRAPLWDVAGLDFLTFQVPVYVTTLLVSGARISGI